jgi:bifunctional ADP-heptose synthase (sugar kinase/adenylyltransferase)
MSKLWVFGDSFSATNDRPVLESWRLDYVKWKGYVPKVFSDFLSDKLGVSARNMGVSGADNYTIIDTIIDSLSKINSDDIIIIGWSTTIRFRVASKNNNFLTIRPNDLYNNISTINDSSDLTNIAVNSLNEIIVNRSDKIYIDEINRYIKLINFMYANNVIIHWSPFKQEIEGMYVTPIEPKIERITEETNGLLYDKHFSEHGHEQISEYFYKLIKNYDNNKKVKLL